MIELHRLPGMVELYALKLYYSCGESDVNNAPNNRRQDYGSPSNIALARWSKKVMLDDEVEIHVSAASAQLVEGTRQ